MAVSDLKNKAREAFRRKHYELAVEAYLEYLSFQADDEEAVDGFFQAAVKARETRGKSLFGGFLSKLSASSSKDPKKRITSCLRVLAKNPDDKASLMALGDAAIQANAFSAGVVAFKRAATVDPEDPEPWKRLGESLGRRGRIPEALEALGEAVRISPKDQEAQRLRKNLAAEGALKISGYESARSSRELIKDKAVAEQLEVETRLQLTPEHAASEVEKVRDQIAQDQQNPRLRVRLADLLLQQGSEEEALEALEQGLRLDPQNYDLSVRIGDLKLRSVTRAYNQAKEALSAKPQDAELKAAHDRAMAALTEESLAEYGRRVREHPLDLAERFRLGRWLLQAGRVDEALAEFQQTVRDPNRKVDSLVQQAQCFEQKGILTLASKKLEEALTEFPTLSSPKAKDVHYRYGILLEKAGDPAAAARVWERIVEEDAAYKDVLDRLSKAAKGAG